MTEPPRRARGTAGRVVAAGLLALLPSCLPLTPPAASRQASHGRAGGFDPWALPPPNLDGTWYVVPGDGGPLQTWTLALSGSTVTGTIASSTGVALPGPSLPTRPIAGRLLAEGGAWVGLMDSPPGILHLGQDNVSFAFCLGEGALHCARGNRNPPESVPSPLSTTYHEVISPAPTASSALVPALPSPWPQGSVAPWGHPTTSPPHAGSPVPSMRPRP